MKKLFLLLVSLILIVADIYAGRDKAITVDQLPKIAQQFIEKHFADVEVSYAKMDTELFDKSYDVIFVNGSKVEFDKRGEWEKVDCKYTQVPERVIPSKIREFIVKNHPSAKVIKIERDSKAYKVRLNGKLKLKFDLKERFMGYDG